VIQIDGIHMDEDLILVAAIGVDAKGDKHPLGLTEGATENAATVQSLIDNLVERGLKADCSTIRMISSFSAAGYLIRRPPHPQSRLMGWSAPSSRPTLGRCQQEELR
jgi:hypothetical protein